ncbi:MAG: efflux RND transporter permease subunit, partial [Campylobacter concisus]
GLRAIQQKMIEEFNSLNPPSSISYSWGGQTENMQKTMSQLTFALSISIFLIYALLASQFESFIMPYTMVKAMRH